jgi:outer membrane protein assembly factor BamA
MSVTRVGSIIVEGNTKTGADLILDASELRSGIPIEASTLGEARQRILNKRVFSDVQVEAVTNGAIVDLRIVVKERLTLLPVPFVSSSDGQRRGGVFLLDTNLFGRMKTLAAGITLSTLGRSVVGLYQDPSLFSSRWATRVSTLYSDLIQQRRAGPEVVYAFQEGRDELAAALGYKLTRALSLYGGAFYVHVKATANDAYVPPANPDDEAGLSAEIDLRAANYYSYFDEGLVLNARYRRDLLGHAAQSRFRAQLTTRTFNDQSASIILQYVGATGDPYIEAHRLGGNTGTRGFAPFGLWAEHAATATVEYQAPITHFKLGTWTFNGFCDTGHVVWRAETLAFVTPGLGTRFYLKSVAFPAVGLDVSYSTHDARTVISGSAGMSF